MRRLCENLPRVDVREIDFRCGTNWQHPLPDGVAVSTVDNAIHVIHERSNVHISIERTPCNYGGSRHWFLCPMCQDRRAILYFDDDAFGCRRCLRLGYSCEAEDTVARLERKARKLLTRLGGAEGRPQWMRRKKYENLLFEHEVTALRGTILWARKLIRDASR